MDAATLLEAIEAFNFERESGMGRVFNAIMAGHAEIIETAQLPRAQPSHMETELILLLPAAGFWEAIHNEERQLVQGDENHPLMKTLAAVRQELSASHFVPLEPMRVRATVEGCNSLMEGLFRRLGLEPAVPWIPRSHRWLLATQEGNVMQIPIVLALVWRQLLGDQFLVFCCRSQSGTQVFGGPGLVTEPYASVHGILWRSGGSWVCEPVGGPDRREDEEVDGRLDMAYVEARDRLRILSEIESIVNQIAKALKV